mmetsp:Transcript_142342/g.248214  ORF Transcript_142342/g.248214 Transcript_142342/m.248214 type:complete len:653 (-) Transcript_142342:240-2198(-)
MGSNQMMQPNQMMGSNQMMQPNQMMGSNQMMSHQMMPNQVMSPQPMSPQMMPGQTVAGQVPGQGVDPMPMVMVGTQAPGNISGMSSPGSPGCFPQQQLQPGILAVAPTSPTVGPMTPPPAHLQGPVGVYRPGQSPTTVQSPVPWSPLQTPSAATPTFGRRNGGLGSDSPPIEDPAVVAFNAADSVVVAYGRMSPTEDHRAPLQTLLQVGKALAASQQDLPPSVMETSSPLQPPVPQTPPSQQYRISPMAIVRGSRTSDPRERKELKAGTVSPERGDRPLFQTPQAVRAPFGSPDFDYHRENRPVLPERAYDPAEKENTPSKSNSPAQPVDKQLYFTKARSPILDADEIIRTPSGHRGTADGVWDHATPGSRVSLTPGGSHREHGSRTYADLTHAVQEWLLRKFVPRPSAAKPRPYQAVDLGVGRGVDLAKWDKSKCSYLLGVCTTQAGVDLCKSRLKSRDSEMEADFICVDPTTGAVPVPATVKRPTFDIVGIFGGLEQAFVSEARARQMIANAASLLKKGGQLLVITNDSEAIQERVVNVGRSIENDVFKFSFSGDSRQLADEGGYGLEYSLKYDDAPPGLVFVVPKETLRRLCAEHGLEPLPHDHGCFNFQDVASYIEKSASKGHVWRELPGEHRELVSLWGTYVFQKMQ